MFFVQSLSSLQMAPPSTSCPSRGSKGNRIYSPLQGSLRSRPPQTLSFLPPKCFSSPSPLPLPSQSYLLSCLGTCRSLCGSCLHSRSPQSESPFLKTDLTPPLLCCKPFKISQCSECELNKAPVTGSGCLLRPLPSQAHQTAWVLEPLSPLGLCTGCSFYLEHSGNTFQTWQTPTWSLTFRTPL